ncbi:MAG: glycerol-3-phosphate 1-O-acyltransferase PlsY [Verrucomicrobiales bacterium]|nr:glycerol-3-phosphate 1-O-acyltransferase PlsY [Verrucomicrobiales bacterium]
MTDNTPITAGILILTGYFIGSIPFGYLAGKLRGIDIREHGSGNIGATNVLRTLGKSIGIPVLILDVLKGLLPVLIAQHFSDQTMIHILTAFATIMGHNYTLWLRFKGGKGIATSAGSLIPLIAIPLAIAVLIWVILFFTTRYVSVASIGAALAIPIVTIMQQSLQNEWNLAMISFTVLLATLATWKHRSNIIKLYHGTENRFTPKSKKTNSQTDV